MSFSIYFHRDFDGICSAAVFSACARAMNPPITPTEYVPVDYDLRKSWLERRLNTPCAIVDFLYHPDADWWFDHHETTFIRRDWELSYHSDSRHVWCTSYKSCPRLILDSVSDAQLRRRLDGRFSEYLDWCDLIDSASYQSPIQAVEWREPALQINATLSQNATPEYLEYLIESFGKLSISQVANLSEVRIRYDKAQAWQTEAISYIRRIANLNNDVAFIDLAGHPNLFHRYAAYYLWPELKFQVALYKVGERYKVTVGSNPWRRFEGPDLSAICERYLGGGHPTVAGIMTSSRKQALRIAKEICRILRKEIPFHQQLALGRQVRSNG